MKTTRRVNENVYIIVSHKDKKKRGRDTTQLFSNILYVQKS